MIFPTLIVNLKIYKEGIGKNSILFCKYAKELIKKYDIPIFIAVNPLDIRLCLKGYKEVVISQTADVEGYGAKTGHISIDVLADLGVSGTLINHSEHKTSHKQILKLVTIANKRGVNSIVCVDSVDELLSLINLGIKPTAYAIEPPELIGSGKSVSKYKPETVRKAVKIGNENNIPILCGAGVVDGEDVNIALSLGTRGVLVASGVVKSEKPYVTMEEMVKAMLPYKNY